MPLSSSAGENDDRQGSHDIEEENAKATQYQEDDDWGGAWSSGSQDGGLFKRDGPFAIFLIILSTVISTVLFQMGLRRIKNVSRISHSRQELSRSASVYAPVVPKEETAQQYKTGWPDDIPDRWSNTIEDQGKLPLRTPDAASDMDTAISTQRQQYERLKEQVDGSDHADSGRAHGGQETRGYYDWDAIFSDDEAPYSGMTLTEMKDRAKKASKSATRAAAYAHQASIAASIATKATHEAQTAAHRAIEAALKSERALERKSGQAIAEAYASVKRAEDNAEKNARVAAEMAAKALLDEKSSIKASRQAVACEDVTRPHGVVNKCRALWYDLSGITLRTVAFTVNAGSVMVSACQEALTKLLAQGNSIFGMLKQHLPSGKVSAP